MKLSIITPIYKETKFVNKFLTRMIGQTSKAYELILIVDTSFGDCISVVDKFKDELKGKIKIIFNTSRTGRHNAISKGIQAATGDYSIIVSVTDIFKEDMVTMVNNLTKKQKTDIIEFNARFHKPFWMIGKPRKNIRTIAKLKKEDIFAYVWPFEFNKIFKTPLLKMANMYPKIFKTPINSRFSIEIIFKAIYLCQTYSTAAVKIVRTKRNIDFTFNPLLLSREWDEIMKDSNFQEYKTSIKYNKYFTFKAIYSPISYANKNKMLIAKINNLINKEFNKDYKDSCRYLLLENKESQFLKEFDNKVTPKAYKEF